LWLFSCSCALTLLVFPQQKEEAKRAKSKNAKVASGNTAVQKTPMKNAGDLVAAEAANLAHQDTKDSTPSGIAAMAAAAAARKNAQQSPKSSSTPSKGVAALAAAAAARKKAEQSSPATGIAGAAADAARKKETAAGTPGPGIAAMAAAAAARKQAEQQSSAPGLAAAAADETSKKESGVGATGTGIAAMATAAAARKNADTRAPSNSDTVAEDAARGEETGAAPSPSGVAAMAAAVAARKNAESSARSHSTTSEDAARVIEVGVAPVASGITALVARKKVEKTDTVDSSAPNANDGAQSSFHDDRKLETSRSLDSDVSGPPPPPPNSPDKAKRMLGSSVKAEPQSTVPNGDDSKVGDNKPPTASLSTIAVGTMKADLDDDEQKVSSLYKLPELRSTNKQSEWITAVKTAIERAMNPQPSSGGAGHEESASSTGDDFWVNSPSKPTRYTQADWLGAIESSIQKVKYIKKTKTPKNAS